MTAEWDARGALSAANRAVKGVFAAAEEWRVSRGAAHLDTGGVLLGVLELRAGAASDALAAANVSRAHAEAVLRAIGSGRRPSGQLERAVISAGAWARGLGDTSLRSGHVLLGLLGESDSDVGVLLDALSVRRRPLRDRVLTGLAREREADGAEPIARHEERGQVQIRLDHPIERVWRLVQDSTDFAEVETVETQPPHRLTVRPVDPDDQDRVLLIHWELAEDGASTVLRYACSVRAAAHPAELRLRLRQAEPDAATRLEQMRRLLDSGQPCDGEDRDGADRDGEDRDAEPDEAAAPRPVPTPLPADKNGGA